MWVIPPKKIRRPKITTVYIFGHFFEDLYLQKETFYRQLVEDVGSYKGVSCASRNFTNFGSQNAKT